MAALAELVGLGTIVGSGLALGSGLLLADDCAAASRLAASPSRWAAAVRVVSEHLHHQPFHHQYADAVRSGFCRAASRGSA